MNLDMGGTKLRPMVIEAMQDAAPQLGAEEIELFEGTSRQSGVPQLRLARETPRANLTPAWMELVVILVASTGRAKWQAARIGMRFADDEYFERVAHKGDPSRAVVEYFLQLRGELSRPEPWIQATEILILELSRLLEDKDLLERALEIALDDKFKAHARIIELEAMLSATQTEFGIKPKPDKMLIATWAVAIGQFLAPVTGVVAEHTFYAPAAKTAVAAERVLLACGYQITNNTYNINSNNMAVHPQTAAGEAIAHDVSGKILTPPPRQR